jgi:hypothetical protein
MSLGNEMILGGFMVFCRKSRFFFISADISVVL